MKYLNLPVTSAKPLPFYLAAEEWAARCLPPDDYFFVWQVDPTVICGRHQDIGAEVNLDYCRREGIAVVRRLSGGGAVYADRGNFMFSYITPGDEITGTFARYTGMVAEMLRGIGIDAVATGRNDIVVGYRKISGNAFYHLPDRCIVHGTMLYTIDAERLAHVLTPNKAKLESKGIKSVPMRVTCLSELGCRVPLDEFGEFAVRSLTDSVRTVAPDELRQIEALEQKYYEPDRKHFRDNSGQCCSSGIITRATTVPGVGEIKARISIDTNNIIQNISLEGDFFILSDIETLCRRFRGVEFSRKPLAEALAGTEAGACIAGLSNEALLSLITE